LTPAGRFARGESGHVVRFRDLPEAITQGDDLASALSEASDCLEEAIAGRIVNGEDIPIPSRPAKGERLIPLPAQMAAKAALYLAMREAGIGKSELARRLGCDEKDVRRLLDPRYGSKLPKIDAALAVLGKRLEIVVRDAA
jgi:antitoxin HicB